jgi:hypothetical protein
MAIYTDEEIAKLTKRWEGKEEVLSQVLEILRCENLVQTTNDSEIARRLNNANDLLTKNGFTKMGDCYISSGWVEIPSLDLRGVNYVCESDLQCEVFVGAHLEGSQFGAAYLLGTNLSQACLECSDLSFTDLKGAILTQTHLAGANFDWAEIGILKEFIYSDHCLLSAKERIVLQDSLKDGRKTTFIDVDYLPRWRNHFFSIAYIYFKLILKDIKVGNLPRICRNDMQVKMHKKIKWKNFWRHLFHRRFYTTFLEVRIDDADTVMAPDLYRYVKDQQYLYRFKKTHPWIYRIWKLFSDCGGKLSVVAFWSGILICAFAFLYSLLPPEIINFQPFFERAEKLSSFWKWIYVSFDIFSSLGIRNAYPQHWLGVVLMIFESCLGFLMLGMLISVLQNRFARRS